MGRKTGAKTESTPAEKRLKAFSGIGLGTNQRQLAKALETLSTLPIEDAVEVLGSKRWQLQEAVDHLWSQCGCEVDLEITADKYWTLPCTSLAKTLAMMVEKFPEFHTKVLALRCGNQSLAQRATLTASLCMAMSWFRGTSSRKTRGGRSSGAKLVSRTSGQCTSRATLLGSHCSVFGMT